MQPAPHDGSLPLAANRWYMMQYEMAYDPTLTQIPYDQIQLSWNLNYYNVQRIELGGNAVGELNGVIGKASEPNFFTPLIGAGKTAGTGVLAGIGRDFITKNTIDKERGTNKLGIDSFIFQQMSKGISSAMSTADFPKALVNLLNVVIGGSTETPISMTMKVNMELSGTGTEGGVFSFYAYILLDSWYKN